MHRDDRRLQTLCNNLLYLPNRRIMVENSAVQNQRPEVARRGPKTVD